MSLAGALDTALQLKAALATEVTRSKELRRLLKTIDAEALMAQASLRDAFNHHSAYLSGELAKALGAVAAGWGAADLTLDDLRHRAPFEGEQLASVFAEIRALTASLHELDALNHLLAERSLAFVKAYLTHLAPRPTAYSRRGAALPLEAATHSEHV
jgi:multidrug efflux pump subunit AcrA (membrane-fusion protein)